MTLADKSSLTIAQVIYPATEICSLSIGTILGQRRRRWPNVMPVLGHCYTALWLIARRGSVKKERMGFQGKTRGYGGKDIFIMARQFFDLEPKNGRCQNWQYLSRICWLFLFLPEKLVIHTFLISYTQRSCNNFKFNNYKVVSLWTLIVSTYCLLVRPSNWPFSQIIPMIKQIVLISTTILKVGESALAKITHIDRPRDNIAIFTRWQK